jgi:hypothetical protein
MKPLRLALLWKRQKNIAIVLSLVQRLAKRRQSQNGLMDSEKSSSMVKHQTSGVSPWRYYHEQ